MPSNAKATATTDHEEIRRWAEERGAKPSCVRNTGDRNDIGILRLDFPGYSGADSLEEISWDDWFEKFDERGLALLHQETTARGQKSNFNKIVSRETADAANQKSQSSSSSRSSSRSNTSRASGSSTRSSRSTASARSANSDSGRSRTTKSEGRSNKHTTEVKPTQKGSKVTSISHKKQGSTRTRSSGKHAA